VTPRLSPAAARRLARERHTIEVMIGIACRGRHAESRVGLKRGSLCPECEQLLAYAMERVDKCPFADDKPTCARCPVHCYRAAERAQVRAVMRYAGPRMMFHHPILTIRHYSDELSRRRSSQSGSGR
jgi:hypothetical protein